jgi:site-specific recombinase XerC
MLTAVQTGMRLSELVGLDGSAVTVDTGAHSMFRKGPERTRHTDRQNAQCYAQGLVG